MPSEPSDPGAPSADGPWNGGRTDAPGTPTLLDLARSLGVSVATVSRALSGKPGVGAELAARIRARADDVGYVANSTAKALVAGSSNVVGLLVHQIDNLYFGEMASAVADAADSLGLTLQIGQTGRDPERQHRQIRTLMSQRARCIIVAGSSYTLPVVEARATEALTSYAEAGGRVVTIGAHHVRSDSVRFDEAGAGAAVAQHLLDLGHRRIAVMSGPPNMTTVVERLRGLRATFDGEPSAQAHVLHTDFSREEAYTVTEQLMRDYPETTAILALSDTMAVGVLRMLANLGIDVPGQVSVTGLDDTTTAALTSLTLTSVRFPIREAGREALRLGTTPVEPEPRVVEMGHELMVRTSTAPPRS